MEGCGLSELVRETGTRKKPAYRSTPLSDPLPPARPTSQASLQSIPLSDQVRSTFDSPLHMNSPVDQSVDAVSIFMS